MKNMSIVGGVKFIEKKESQTIIYSNGVGDVSSSVDTLELKSSLKIYFNTAE